MNAYSKYPQLLICPDPDHCTALHNEDRGQGEDHHYGCECDHCVDFYWSLK